MERRMEIAFFTEAQYTGKVPRNHPNMRTDLAWVCASDADHYNIHNGDVSGEYDLGICIIPKKNPNFDINRIRQSCKKVAIMQEGPHWYFQDYPLEQQIWYFNILQQADFLFVHNEIDKKYYSGLTQKECRILPSLMIEDNITDLPVVDRANVMIGGNFCNWYGGFDSYIVAQEFDCKLAIPSMGRKIEGEEQMPNLNHLPYMNWTDWIKTLNRFKYGVHMMRTHAAGTFALNCACLGIPCIGYKGLDTQELCHPNLTVEIGDIPTAIQLAIKLKNDHSFYIQCEIDAISGYDSFYSEEKFGNVIKKLYI